MPKITVKETDSTSSVTYFIILCLIVSKLPFFFFKKIDVLSSF